MGKGSSTTLALALVGSAFAVGIGSAYAPVPTFVGPATVFLLMIWWFTKHGRPYHPRRGRVEGFESESFDRIQQRSQADPIGRLVSIFLLVWWTALLLTQRVGTGAPRDFTLAAQITQQSAAEGSVLNQLLVLSYAAVGLLFLLVAMNRPSQTLRWILALWFLYLCWGGITLLWSVEPALSVRRLTAFSLISLGSIGFGAGFYGVRPNGRSLLLHHTVWAGVLAALALLIPWFFRSDAMELLDPSYIWQPAANTYSYVAVPATVALMTMVATSMLGLRKWRRYDWFLASVLGFAILVLKMRGPALYAVLALGVLYLLHKVTVGERLLPLGLLLTAPVAVFAFSSDRALSWLLPYLTRNVGPYQTYWLSGRIPLWETLLFDAKQRLLGGVGFGAYWNPSTYARIYQAVGWPAPVAHNGYLDEVLATGTIGLALLLIFWTYVTVTAFKQVRRGDDFAWVALLFVTFYMLYNLTQSLMQQYLEVPFMILLALVGLMGSSPPAKLHRPVKPTQYVRDVLKQE